MSTVLCLIPGSNVFACCDILGHFFGILDKGVWRRASLTLVSLLLYNMHVSCSNLQQTEPWNNSVLLRCTKASRWSAGNASPLLSGWGLSYNHSQCTYGRLQELDIRKIEMGTALVINSLWAILNNTTANIDIPLYCGPILFAGWLIFMHLELFLPLAPLVSWQLHKGDGRGEEIQGRHRHHRQKPGPLMCFVMPSLPDLQTHLRS